MSIEALILGKLHEPAQRRTSTQTGREFVTAKVRASTGEGEALFVNVAAFAESVGEALLALGPGDALALAGTLKPGAWLDREGKARPCADLVASQVLSVYALRKKRAAVQGATPSQQRQPAPDDFPPDDAWLNGGSA